MDQFSDSDLLVSIFIKRKADRDECSTKNKRISKCGSLSSEVGSRKTGRRQLWKKDWFTTSLRTVSSWLIHCGVVSLNEVIQFRRAKDNVVIKESIATKEGLLCTCCNKMLSISEFEIHAGFEAKRQGGHLFVEFGKPLMLCQLEAWSLEYKARKSPLEAREVDDSDYLCGLCGLDGELVCCDGCPATFHQACLFEQLPEGNWYCPQCRCLTCSDLVSDKNPSLLSGMICSLCKHRYHKTCMNGKDMNIGMTSGYWFCEQSCHEIYRGLQSRIGLTNHLPDDLCWRLLRCIDGDHKAHASQDFLALKAECNSKLAVAVTLLEEYFLEMVDTETKIDMIPQVIYNWRSQFPRLNFEGFYTIVLEKKDVMVSVASIRIHGKQVAELPFVATCSRFRTQGMCRILVSCIEQMLKCLKIEKLVIPASDDDLADLWTNKFGFQLLKEEDRSHLRNVNLILLPGSTWLVKCL